VPAYWFWFSYIDFIRFAWGALMVNQFSGPKGDPVWLNGQTVLQHYGLKDFKFHGAFLSPPRILRRTLASSSRRAFLPLGKAHYTWYTGTVRSSRPSTRSLLTAH